MIVIGWKSLVFIFLKLNKGVKIIRIIDVVKKIGLVIFFFVSFIDDLKDWVFLCEFEVLVFNCLKMFLIIIMELFINILIVIVILLSDIKFVDSFMKVMMVNVIVMVIGIVMSIRNVVFMFIKKRVRMMVIKMKVMVNVFIMVEIVFLIRFVWL